MNVSFRLAGAAALCAALLLTACAKKSSDTTTSTGASTATVTDMPIAGGSPDATATTAPDATATSAADASATSAPVATSTSGSGKYITLPVYPGATERKDQAISNTSNEGSVAMTVYSTKDSAKTVADWYKSHLPAAWKSNVLTAGDKTIGTFVDEHADGDQSIIVGQDSDGTTRIQLTTKHGK